MRAFLRQLRWELVRLVRRPRSALAFAACLVFQVVMVALQQLPAVREHVVQSVWRIRIPIDRAAAFSGIATAVEVLGESIVYGGVIFLALVAGDIVAKEVEDGTLRTVLCRPVSRASLFTQKLVVCVLYTAALVTFASLTALGFGLAAEGTGRMLILVPRDNLMGMLEFGTALQRYVLAIPLHVASLLTVTLLAFTLSCFPMTPAAATALTLGVLFADWMVHLNPMFATVSSYSLARRLGTWRQVFNDDVPWLRIQRNLRQLFWLDLGLVGTAALAWGRRELFRRH